MIPAADVFWAERHRTAPEGWAARYWHSVDMPHRHHLVGEVMRHHPETVLEVGCNAAPNLRLLLERAPHLRVAGIDLNVAAIEYAEQQFGNDPRVRLTAGYLQHEIWKADPADVVFSCYALAYLDPAEVEPVVRRMLGLARRAVVIAEPMVLGHEPEGRIAEVLDMPEWRHDYQQFVAWRGVRQREMRLQAIEPVDRLNGILTITVGRKSDA